MKPAVVGSYQNLLTTGPTNADGSGGNQAIRFEEAGSILYANVGNDTAGNSTGSSGFVLTSSLAAGHWVHVALTWDSDANRVQGYVNGVQVFMGTNTTWPSNFGNVNFGLGWASNPAYQRYYNGLLSDVRFYNVQRTQAQIQGDSSQMLTGSEPGLIGYWPLNDGSGTTAADRTAGQHNGALGGGTAWAPGQNATAVNIQGGTLSGSGTIYGNVTNAAVMDLGGAPATLQINGNYTQTAAGALNLKVGGSNSGSGYDQIHVGGTATLDGTLNVSLINGFGASGGQVFNLINFAGSNGGFATVNLPQLSGMPAFITQTTATSFNLIGATTAPDLAVTAVSFTPSSATDGQNLTVNYTITNQGTVTATGSWVDSVYLSPDRRLHPESILLGRVPHIGNLAGLAAYNGTLTARVPGIVDGAYRVVVVADSGLQIPDIDRTNNVVATTSPLFVRATLLPIGTPISGSVADGQDLYFRVNVPPGSDVKLTADFAAGLEAEAFVRFAGMPTISTYDQASDVSDQHPQIVLSASQGGQHYVLLHGRDGAGSGQPFTLQAALAAFEVDAIDVASAVNNGKVTVTVTGTGFTPQTTLMLRGPSGDLAATSVTFIDSNTVAGTFDLTGLLPGSYTVEADDGTQSATAQTAFQVVADQPPPPIKIDAHVTSPRYVRIVQGGLAVGHTSIPVDFTVTGLPPGVKVLGVSTSLQDITFFLVGPRNVIRGTGLFGLHSDNALLGGDSFVRNGNGKAGIHLDYLPTSLMPHLMCTFTSGPAADSSTTDQQTKVFDRPIDFSSDAWDVVWGGIGRVATPDILPAVLQADLQYFDQIGEPNVTTNDILDFEQMKANAEAPAPFLDLAVDAAFPEPGMGLVLSRAFMQPISGRYQLGMLGRGWASNWDISASTDSYGDVFIHEGGIVRLFVTQADGSYQGIGGERGTLTLTDNGFLLTELNGTVTAFLPDGRLNYVQDQYGNQITAGYTGSLLTSLAHSNGDQMLLSYNAAGRVSQVTDPAGRVATYTYDASGEHLTSVTTPQGTTQYTYVTGQGAAREHALASVTDATGAQRNFEYDTQGRLSKVSEADGLRAVTYSYLSPAGYTMTDASGATTTVLVDILNRPAVVTDALGKVTRYHYDNAGRLTGVTAPDGKTATQFGYDSQGNPTLDVDPLGNSRSFTADPQTGDVSTFQNELGSTTQFAYSLPDTVQTITAPDDSTREFAHDALGRLTKTVNSRGQAVTYTYDSHNRLLRKSYPDGTHTDFTYDPHGNMLTATDASGSITMAYDSADRLTQITYPSGRSLSYTYDAAGRRAQVKDQSGFTVNYAYDANGRLTDLTDAGGASIVHYMYDSVGRLQQENHGNGTYTTYEYDLRGDLLHLINYAPTGTVNSRFDYAYDDLGRRTSMTTLDGTTTYGYDADGRLTSASLPGGRTIQYQYDAAGNRVAVKDNGATTAYTTNNLDQYTAVGQNSYSYDADGNRTVTSGPSEPTSYVYDFENRLIGVTTPTDSWTYQYDAFGQRVASTHNGQTTQYLVDPTGLGNVLGEYDSAGSLVAHYTAGLGLTSRVDATGSADYYDFDALGSTAGLSDSTGSYVNRYDYSPFGESANTSETVPNPFQFAGMLGVRLEGNGLNVMGARFYDAGQGRFIQADPSGLAGGSNHYTYAVNNPVSFVDASGSAPDIVIKTGVTWGGKWGNLWGPGFEMTSKNLEYFKNVISGALSETFAPLETGAAEALGPLANQAPEVAAELGGVALDSGNILATNITHLGLNYEQFAPLVEAARAAQAAKNIFPVVEAASKVAAPAAEFGAGALLNFIPAEVGDNSLFGRLLRDHFGGPIAKPPPLFIHLKPNVGIGDLFQVFTFSKSITELVDVQDPNSVVGPSSFGSQNYVPANAPLPYIVNFENKPTASAAAQVVSLTQQLDPNLDWSTFELGSFNFGSYSVTVPPGRQEYSTRVDARKTLGVYVDVSAALNRLTGLVTWTFTTIDPTTLDQPSGNTLEGFLPPDDSTGRGEGWVSYTIQPLAGDVTGTVVNAKATVIFDAGMPDHSSLDTAPIFNTIDAGTPTSSVASLPAVSLPTFTVSWSGQDDAGGSGVAAYDVFVSDNGGPFTAWLTGTTQTSAGYTGASGHTYAFYSVATDNVGNREATPTTAEASTLIVTPTTTTLASDQTNGSLYGQAVTFTATVNATAAAPTGSVQFQIDGSNFGPPVPLTGATASIVTAALPATEHDIVAVYLSDDGHFLSSDNSANPLRQTVSAAPLTVTADDASRVYAVPNPAFTAHYAGFVLGQGPADLSGTVLLTTDATVKSHVGSYSITPSGEASSNYRITFAAGTLSITPATLTITATGINKPYDGTTTATVILSDDRVAGDSLTDGYVSASFTGPNVGIDKTVNVSGISISGPDAANYDLANTTAVATANILGPAIEFTSAAQTLTAGTVSGIMTVQWVDEFGNPVNAGRHGRVVLLVSSSRLGVFRNVRNTATITQVTIPAGHSTASFRYVDTRAGTPLLTARSTGLTSGIQIETVNAAAPAGLTLTGSNQNALINTAFSTPLTAIVRDRFGNPVPGVTVTFTPTVSSHGASGTIGGGNSATTDADGKVVKKLTANGTAGFYSVRVAASGGGNPHGTIVQLGNLASQLVFLQQPSTGVAGGILAPVVIQLSDATGNPISRSGVPVTIAVSSGTLLGTRRVLTNAHGQAIFKNLVIRKAGTYTLAVTSNGALGGVSGSLSIMANPLLASE
jgi:RHS repeat-associated protein